MFDPKKIKWNRSKAAELFFLGLAFDNNCSLSDRIH
jgi:hypothetical protein